MERYRRTKLGGATLPAKPGPGRPKGSLNLITRALKDIILNASEEVGWPTPVYRKDIKGAVVLSKQGCPIIDGYVPGEGGSLGYVMFLACNHVGQYRSLLQAIIPDQRNDKSNMIIEDTPYKTIAEADAALKEAGLPIPKGGIYADPMELLEAIRINGGRE